MGCQDNVSQYIMCIARLIEVCWGGRVKLIEICRGGGLKTFQVCPPLLFNGIALI